MAILTMYQAAKKYGMSQAALKRQCDLNPRPAYFINIKDYDFPKIDEDSQPWIYYKNRYNARMRKSKNKSTDSEVDKVINATIKVLNSEFSESIAEMILKKIEQELSN
jgi:hypothetical protein